jgi:ABC-type lipoprotein release transport system permease subunit
MDRLWLLGPLAWRNLWRNPRRTLITLAVVAVGVWSILSFDVMFKAWGQSSLEESLRLLTGEGQIHAAGYLDDPGVGHSMPYPTGALLRTLTGPAVGAWSPRVRVPAIIQSEYRTRAITLLGVEPSAERQVSDLPGQMLAGRYLANDSEIGIVIGADLAVKLKTRLGKRVIVMAQAADGHLAEVGLPIIGLFGNTTPAQDEYAFVGLNAAQSTLGLNGRLSEIAFDAGPHAKLEDTVAALQRAASSLDTETWMALSPLAYTMEQFSTSYTAIWLMVMFVLMAIGIVNTQLMAVFERTREFGLLQALGMRPATIVAQVMLESALLIGVGVIAGIVLMVVTLLPFTNGLSLGFLSAGSEMAGGGGVLYPRLDPVDTVVYAAIVWVLGVLTTLWPARTAARTPPVVAMAAG